VYIPKANGKLRPLGISCYEDKLVEANIAELLSAVYETKFLDCSFGFRPERNCHQAISELKRQIITEKVSYVVEADIKSFFDTVDHEWLLKFLEHNIADKKLMRLIRRFLDAGYMEDGKHMVSSEGTPQGGAISPVLANVYLHYVLDLWFEKVVKARCRGYAGMVRYADDWVCTFQNKSDAERFMVDLKERLAKFNLELAPDKTKMLEFGRFAADNRKERGQCKPETFNFLGFTLYCGKTLREKFTVKLKTDSTRVAKKLKGVKEWMRKNMMLSVEKIVKRLNMSLIGYFNYYYVTFNARAVNVFVWQVGRMLMKWMNRRSQRRSMTWKEFNASWVKQSLVAPRNPKRI
jgi:group II intron reverse transcriptase/maturase